MAMSYPDFHDSYFYDFFTINICSYPSSPLSPSLHPLDFGMRAQNQAINQGHKSISATDFILDISVLVTYNM